MSEAQEGQLQLLSDQWPNGTWVVEETTDGQGRHSGYSLNVYDDVQNSDTAMWVADLGPVTGGVDGEIIAKRLNDYQPLAAALLALWETKQLKDGAGKTAEYEQRRAFAWSAAERALRNAGLLPAQAQEARDG